MIEKNQTGPARRARLLRKLRSRGGYSLAEALVALVILMMVSGGMVDGIRYASEQYHKSMIRSEAKILCSTLTNVIRSELSNATQLTLDGATLKSFAGTNYALENETSDTEGLFIAVEVQPDGSSFKPAMYNAGELLFGTVSGDAAYGKLLLGSASYSSYGFRVRIDPITYASGVFSVTLHIYENDGTTELITNSFDVIQLTTPPPESPAP